MAKRNQHQTEMVEIHDSPSEFSDDCEIGTKKPKMEILSETDVGISSFRTLSNCGFSCTLKNRWEDFIVYEIRNANLAKLTDLNAIDKSEEEEKISPDVDHHYRKLLVNHLSQLSSLDEGKIKEVLIEAPLDKQSRTVMHVAIRSLFPKLVSCTNTENDQRFITVTKMSQKNKHKRSCKTNKATPYCQFVLYKEGKDTISCINLLGKFLHTSSGSFSYCGTKDKRAITTQFVRVKGVNSTKLAALNTRLNGIRLGNFEYASTPLFLGDLDGNRFIVILRSVCETEENIRNFVNNWTQFGFINYFGLQRFGHCSKANSFLIGKHLIKSDWAAAMDLILMPSSSDLPHIRNMKNEYLKTQDANSCAEMVSTCLEKTLLLGVAKHGKTLNAFEMLPRNLRQLYVHSYQSLIWNHVASFRMSQQDPGDDLAKPGDLYFHHCQFTENEFDAEQECSTKDKSESIRQPYVVDNENSLKIPLTSVVIPVPGYSVILPQNQSGELFTELLNKDGLQMINFKHRVKDYSLPGYYRRLIVIPENVEFELKTYSDPNIPLVSSDLELLNQTKELQYNFPENSGTEQALVLKFNLPKSSYATMAIRELTKSVTEKK